MKRIQGNTVSSYLLIAAKTQALHVEPWMRRTNFAHWRFVHLLLFYFHLFSIHRARDAHLFRHVFSLFFFFHFHFIFMFHSSVDLAHISSSSSSSSQTAHKLVSLFLLCTFMHSHSAVSCFCCAVFIIGCLLHFSSATSSSFFILYFLPFIYILFYFALVGAVVVHHHLFFNWLCLPFVDAQRETRTRAYI